MSIDSLTEAKRNFAKAAAQAEVAAAEKEAKMKMCKYSPDLSMECGCFPRMFNNSIRPLLSASRSGGGASRRKKNEG
jgi:hypothetical protein